MQDTQLTIISNFLWAVSDAVLRDLYTRGKYRDVILPMTVLRRLDAVLEPSKQKMLAEKQLLDTTGLKDQDDAMQIAAGHTFYNTSPFTLRDVAARTTQKSIRADFDTYLDGYSANVQDILEKFDFRHELDRLTKSNTLGALISKFMSPDINLSPYPVKNDDGSVRLPGLDNHAMGTIFENLICRFNEKNNEETGEHWTPRDAVELMAQLVFQPVADQITSGDYTLYDGALGTGGMLTLAEQTLHDIAAEQGHQVSTHLYGQEINPETYAICKADLLLRDDKESNSRMVGGPQHSTLSNDAFGHQTFDFLLSNPPYGKSWKTDLELMGGKAEITDPRFVVQHGDDPQYSLVTRVNDGQMMFLANMISKMNHHTALGSRIAEVHNGSSLFTGDVGQGENNIRRWVIENDWLEAIIALPLNMFYNTGIQTYIWMLTNRKPTHRQGYVQLIDATKWFTPLRRNLGQKNCELSEADINKITDTFLKFEETEQSKIFPNAGLGYWKVNIERPLRVAGTHPDRVYQAAEIKKLRNDGQRDPNATPVIKRVLPPNVAPYPLVGLFATTIKGQPAVVEYEPDPDLRDTERIPLLEDGGIEEFIEREVLPHVADAWYMPFSIKAGYEINFNRHFYKPQPMRPLEDITADIMALEKECQLLLAQMA